VPLRIDVNGGLVVSGREDIVDARLGVVNRNEPIGVVFLPFFLCFPCLCLPFPGGIP
jgi:hypothetical protein